MLVIHFGAGGPKLNKDVIVLDSATRLAMMPSGKSAFSSSLATQSSILRSPRWSRDEWGIFFIGWVLGWFLLLGLAVVIEILLCA
jgi:hypothetical protein